MIRINLLPTKAARKKESVIQQLVVAVIALVATGGACWWVHQGIGRDIEAEQIQINDLQVKIDQLEAVRLKVEDFKKKKKDLNNKIDTIKDLNAKRTGPVKLLEEFTYVLPRKAWIITFRESEKQVTLEGVAIDGPTVADFVDSLRASKYFHDVQLIQVTQSEDDGKKVARFNVNCRVNYNPAGKSS